MQLVGIQGLPCLEIKKTEREKKSLFFYKEKCVHNFSLTWKSSDLFFRHWKKLKFHTVY